MNDPVCTREEELKQAKYQLERAEIAYQRELEDGAGGDVDKPGRLLSAKRAYGQCLCRFGGLLIAQATEEGATRDQGEAA